MYGMASSASLLGLAVLLLTCTLTNAAADRRPPPMTKQQLALQRFMHNMTAGDPREYSELWRRNGLQSDQTRQTALRYSLAFLGYAAAALSYTHTPAYREVCMRRVECDAQHAAQVATNVLSSCFLRMLQPVAYDYWYLQHSPVRWLTYRLVGSPVSQASVVFRG